MRALEQPRILYRYFMVQDQHMYCICWCILKNENFCALILFKFSVGCEQRGGLQETPRVWEGNFRENGQPGTVQIWESCSISVADPGCLSRIRIFSIPDPGSKRLPDHGSAIRIKELRYFNPKQLFLSSRKYDPGSQSRIRILDPDLIYFYSSRIPGSKRHRIADPVRNTAFYLTSSVIFILKSIKLFRVSFRCGSFWSSWTAAWKTLWYKI